MAASELGVVIPVYNERDNIRRTLDGLGGHLGVPSTVYVLYDFPQDTTLEALQGYSNPAFRLETVHNDLGRGVVNALRKGFQVAREPAVMVVMADLADDLAALPVMLSALSAGCDVVCGSRYMRGGRQIGGPWLKGLMSRCAGLSLYYLAGLPTHDATNSFKLYRRDVLDRVTLESQGGFEIGLEIVVKAWMAGFRVGEVPSVWRDRTAGQSRFRLWKWLPCYLRWYFMAMSFGLRRRLGLP